jgi:DNA-binding response OmpR family regulator
MNGESTLQKDNGRGQPTHDSLHLGPMEIHRQTRRVRIDEREVSLTTAEFDLLWRLARRAGEPVTRDELYADILRREYDGLDRCIDLRVSRLRKKLGDDSRNPRLIKSVRYEGYLLVAE